MHIGESNRFNPVDRLKGLVQRGWVASNAIRIAAALAFSLSFFAVAEADETSPIGLANSCAACHGTDGMSPGPIPSLQGLGAGEIEKMLLRFKSGDLQVTVMNRIAKGYTDAEIKALARHFGALGR